MISWEFESLTPNSIFIVFYLNKQGKWHELDQVSHCNLLNKLFIYNSFCQQTFDTTVVLPEKLVKIQKVTIAAVNSKRILGYAKKNLTYKMRSPRKQDINEIEELILEIIKKNSMESSSWKLNITKDQCLIIVAVIITTVMAIILLYICCKRKRKSASESGAQEEATNVAEIV